MDRLLTGFKAIDDYTSGGYHKGFINFITHNSITSSAELMDQALELSNGIIKMLDEDMRTKAIVIIIGNIYSGDQSFKHCMYPENTVVINIDKQKPGYLEAAYNMGKSFGNVCAIIDNTHANNYSGEDYKFIHESDFALIINHDRHIEQSDQLFKSSALLLTTAKSQFNKDDYAQITIIKNRTDAGGKSFHIRKDRGFIDSKFKTYYVNEEEYFSDRKMYAISRIKYSERGSIILDTPIPRMIDFSAIRDTVINKFNDIIDETEHLRVVIDHYGIDVNDIDFTLYSMLSELKKLRNMDILDDYSEDERFNIKDEIYKLERDRMNER